MALVRIRVGGMESNLDEGQLQSFFRYVRNRDLPLGDMIKDALIRAPHRSPGERAAQVLSEFLIDSRKTGQPLLLDGVPYEEYFRKSRLVPDKPGQR
jgi:hypothetical protein